MTSKLARPRLTRISNLTDPDFYYKNSVALYHQLKGGLWHLISPTMPDPVFIIGCSRSGTTVTFETLACAPELISLGYEIPQLWHKLYGPVHNQWHSEAASGQHASPSHRDAYFKFYYQHLGTGQILDKTCINILRLPYLYALFPAARFVYIYRNGRDNISSLIDGWNNNDHFCLDQFLGPSPEPVAIEEGRFNAWHFFLPPDWRQFNQSSLAKVCAWQWLSANQHAQAAKNLIPPNQWFELKYEHFVTNPRQTMEQLFEQLGLTFSSAAQEQCDNLASRPTSMVSGKPEPEKWKKRNYDAICSIESDIADMMQTLGYEAHYAAKKATIKESRHAGC